MYSKSSPILLRRAQTKTFSSSYGESSRNLTKAANQSDYYQPRATRPSGDNRYSDLGAANGHGSGSGPKYSSSPEVFNSSSSARYSSSLPKENLKNCHSKSFKTEWGTKFSSASDLLSKPLSRSNSHHDLANSSRVPDSSEKSRRKTLTYGVSEHDLTRAREAVSSNHSSNFGPTTSSRSVHVSFLSPPVQSYAELPSFSSTTSSLPYLPSESSESPYYNKLSSKSYEKRPSSSFISKSSPLHQSLSLTYPSISPTRNSSWSTKSDGLVLLKKQDLNEIINSSKSCSNQEEKSSWLARSKLSEREELDYKKLSLVNDDVMKLWEETEAENRRLLGEMSRVRSELQDTRYQMDAVSWKASSINAVSDIEKREKKSVMKKLSEMEKELKLLAQSETMTDQALSQLKSDNARLREENQSLIRVISRLSGTSFNPATATASYVCKHGRVHSYNNSKSYNNSRSYNNLSSFNNSGSYNNGSSYNSGSFNSLTSYNQQNSFSLPNSFNNPSSFNNPNSYNNPNGYNSFNNPNGYNTSGSYNNGGTYNNPGAYNNGYY